MRPSPSCLWRGSAPWCRRRAGARRKGRGPRSACKGLQDRGAGADLVGERRDAELDAFAGIAFALPVHRLVLTELLEQDCGEQVRPAKPRGVRWKGAGGCVIVSQSRHLTFSRTVWIIFQRRGITSRVSVMNLARPTKAPEEPRDGERPVECGLAGFEGLVGLPVVFGTDRGIHEEFR